MKKTISLEEMRDRLLAKLDEPIHRMLVYVDGEKTSRPIDYIKEENGEQVGYPILEEGEEILRVFGDHPHIIKVR